ncbi:unnamed protein product, partial [Brenthis ino]
MSNIGYDLDNSGGLMPLIRALIKPPDEDLNAPKPKKPQHPYYKRPGKGHNHDSCDACGEGGDLICCDRCPASFHLGCYDPPLDENDIPAGLWLCRECRASDDKPASTRSSRAQSPADNKSDTDKKTRSLRNSRATSVAKKKGKDENKEKEEEEEAKKENEPEKELSPMEILVKAAKVMNPKQFELPREMRVPCIFPGTEKDGKNGNGLVTVDAWGCVPLPAKSCFVCRATCKLAPLIQCDYCPLLFHQDCLDPPLTALPTGRWMCPNHVEQYIDWKLVKSVSATERVALWDKFSAPLDQHALKVDFIRRARNPRPAFRVKVPVGLRGRVVVPRMVRLHYRRPPPLLPSRRDHVRCRDVMRRLCAGGAHSSDSEGEGGEGGRRALCLNAECPQYRGDGACPMDPGHKPESDSSDLSDSDFEHLKTKVKKRKVSQTEDKSPGKKPNKSDRLELCMDEGVEELLATVEEQLKKLDERLIKLLAWQRLQQVAAGEAAAGRWRSRALGAWGARVAGALRGASRARLARLGLTRAALPSELLARADRERIAALVWGAPPAPAPPAPAAPARDLATALVRAALCEVKDSASGGGGGGLGAAVAMRRAALRVGSDSACDLVLDARCRRVSPRHAVIFCDEVTQHFELINYSEWGSRVNGVLYACDLSRDARPSEAPAPGASAPAPGAPDAAPDPEARADALRQIVRNRYRKPPRLNGSLTKPIEEETECKCPSAPPPASAAWEGSALVPHGALLQFGCRIDNQAHIQTDSFTAKIQLHPDTNINLDLDTDSVTEDFAIRAEACVSDACQDFNPVYQTVNPADTDTDVNVTDTDSNIVNVDYVITAAATDFPDNDNNNTNITTYNDYTIEDSDVEQDINSDHGDVTGNIDYADVAAPVTESFQDDDSILNIGSSNVIDMYIDELNADDNNDMTNAEDNDNANPDGVHTGGVASSGVDVDETNDGDESDVNTDSDNNANNDDTDNEYEADGNDTDDSVNDDSDDITEYPL